MVSILSALPRGSCAKRPSIFKKNSERLLSLDIEEDIMNFDRKTRRELDKLSNEAQRLWEEQRDVLAHARDVMLDAGKTAGDYTKREVLPHAHDTYRSAVAPLLAKVSGHSQPSKKSSNPVIYLLMAIGAIALAAISYAAWQTLRADDDLWVEEDSE